MVFRHALSEAFAGQASAHSEQGAEAIVWHPAAAPRSCSRHASAFFDHGGARLRAMQKAGGAPGQPGLGKLRPPSPSGHAQGKAHGQPDEPQQRIVELEAKIKQMQASLGVAAVHPAKQRSDKKDLMQGFIQPPAKPNVASAAASAPVAPAAEASMGGSQASKGTKSSGSAAVAESDQPSSSLKGDPVAPSAKVFDSKAKPAVPVAAAPAAASTDAPAKRSKARADIGECQSSDGRYTVKVTPDGVRRLYDTHLGKGSIQTRIQCDGEAPRGQQGDCANLSWPCDNIHRPFKGYIEDVADKVKPFCQVPSWHALLVGLGGGYMQTNLAKICAADSHIDTIENSPAVVPIARNMFGFDSNDARQHLEFGDALQVMKHHASAGDKYDFIFTDYNSESSKEFLETAQHLLKPGGRVAVSKTGEFEEDWLGSLGDFFAPVKPARSAEGNFTLMTTAKLGPKVSQPSIAVEEAKAGVAPKVEAPKAHVGKPDAAMPPIEEVKQPSVSVEAASSKDSELKAASMEEKVEAAALPEAPVPEAQAAAPALGKKTQEAAA